MVIKKRESNEHDNKNLFKNELISFFSIIFSVFLFWVMMISHFWFLIWICFAPAFFVVKREKILPLFLFCLLFVVLLNITSFYWFTRYEMKLLFISILLMGVFGFFLCSLSKLLSFNRVLEILCIPILWTGLVLLFSFNPLGSAWVNFAFFWPMMAPLIWFIKGIGVTFLIILNNSLIAEYFYKRNKKVLMVILILFLVIVFCFVYSYYGKTNGKEIKVALIQGNNYENWFWRVRNVNILLDKYENLSLNIAKENPDFIIWPEYSIPEDILLNTSLYNRISNLAKKTNSYLVVGTLIFTNQSLKGPFDNKTDSFLVFSPEGELVGRYDSIRPMVFDYSVLPGKDFKDEIKTKKANFLIRICFEELDPRLFKKNSDFILIAVNNQVFDNSYGMELISLFSSLRAVENKKFVLRASNDGITQIINPYGKVISRLEPYKEGILFSKIYV